LRCGSQLWSEVDIAIPSCHSGAGFGCMLWLLRLAKADALRSIRICFPGSGDAAGTAALLAALNPTRSLQTLRLSFLGLDRGSGLGVGLAGLSSLSCLEIKTQLPPPRWELSRVGQCLRGLTRLRLELSGATRNQYSNEASYQQLPEELGSLSALQQLESEDFLNPPDPPDRCQCMGCKELYCAFVSHLTAAAVMSAS